MPKVDLKKDLPSYRARVGEFAVVDVPPVQYLAVDGAGDPNTSPDYRDALAALYPVAYRLKFLSKRELDRDHVVMPLEALWWADDLTAFTTARDKTRWRWTVLVLVPDWLDATHVDRACAAAREAGVDTGRVHLLPLEEGRCVQTLHVGPYDDEGPVLERMHADVVPGLGLRPTGRHHEVYLSDPRRTAPERLRTILRQPVTDAREPCP